jgi:hypothetical protein
MAEYLAETASAIDFLTDGISRIRDELEQAARNVAVTSGSGQGLPPGLVAMSFLADDEDEAWISLPPSSFATYFGPLGMEIHNDMVSAVLASQVGRRLSLGALSGALLQVAKQGISLVHGNKKPKPPRGESVGSQKLSDVVWEARNQSMHLEDDDRKRGVRECFEALAKDFEKPELLDYSKRNLAFEVVSLLGWREAARVKSDLESLG